MRSSKTRVSGLSWLAAIALVVSACGGDSNGAAAPAPAPAPAPASGPPQFDAVNWQYSSYLAPGSSLMDAISNYFTELNSATGGATNVEEFFSNSLLSTIDILPGVSDGRSELGFTIALYHPDILPLSQVVGVPFVTENAEAQVRTFNEMYQNNEVFRDEWQRQGIHVLSFTPLTNSIIATVRPLDGLDDLRGRSIRSVGFLASAMEVAGVNPVALPAPDIFESLERGVIEGASSYPFDVFIANGLHEAAPYITEPGTGLYNLGVIIINKRLWDSMDPALQQLMTDLITDFYVDHSIELLQNEEVARCDQFLQQGGVPNVFSQGDTARWRTATGDVVVDRWRENARRAGLSDDVINAFFDEYRSTLTRYEATSRYAPGLRACAAR